MIVKCLQDWPRELLVYDQDYLSSHLTPNIGFDNPPSFPTTDTYLFNQSFLRIWVGIPARITSCIFKTIGIKLN